MQIIMAIVAIALITTSFFIPPEGVIDPSVLTASGIIFAFASLFLGREAFIRGKSTKISHGTTSVEISNEDGTTNDEQPSL